MRPRPRRGQPAHRVFSTVGLNQPNSGAVSAEAAALARRTHESIDLAGVKYGERGGGPGPTDAIIRVTSTAICGSDLHLYEVLTPFMDEGDIIGHEPMGIVEGVGSAVTHIKPGDRVVIPFNVSCEHCFMCRQGLQSQCETTQVREYGTGAQFLGYSRLFARPYVPSWLALCAHGRSRRL